MQPADVPARPGRLPTILAWTRLIDWVQSLRGRRLPWFATAFGTGIGLYFALPTEPTPALWAAALVAAGMTGFGAWLWRGGIGPLFALLAILLAGLGLAQLRANLVAGPVLQFRYYGPVEGRVIHLDRSASGAPRLTLDHVRLDRVSDPPRRVRISLHGETAAVPGPGAWVMTTAHLSAPSGPTEPGGFDFQRHAWFLKLGAIGYARVPLLETGPPERGLTLAIACARAGLTQGLRDRLPGQVGAVAAAITTGDRSGLSPEVTEDLRASNLAHLLAISGLHMGLLAGFVFWAVRGGLALIPSLALRYPTRSWAAAVALPVALGYLFISGGSVATQRAFVMAAVMLGAILVGRRAVSLRSVALAALLVLAWRPESLTGPGFQMSFAATGALVLVFRKLSAHPSDWMRGWRGAVVTLLISSVVAGAATAPFAALHFNRVGQFGVLANMLAVPAMGLLIMPLMLIAILLWPLGLEGPVLWLAGQGIAWILFVAGEVAALPGAVRPIPAPGPHILPLLGLGFALIGCAIGRGRLVGASIVLAAALLWSQSERPDILISADGRLVGHLGPEGRAISREKGAGFVAEAWLENDGDPADQARAAARTVAPTDGLPILTAVRRKADIDAALAHCATEPRWIVASVDLPPEAGLCRLLDPDRLRESGALAIRGTETGWQLQTAREAQGQRPWTGHGLLWPGSSRQ
ncbi:MAG: ComEC/Rec2 family competence protein [Pseudomonadota bacterium]